MMQSIRWAPQAWLRRDWVLEEEEEEEAASGNPYSITSLPPSPSSLSSSHLPHYPRTQEGGVDTKNLLAWVGKRVFKTKNYYEKTLFECTFFIFYSMEAVGDCFHSALGFT